jgi:hypothetical protein
MAAEPITTVIDWDPALAPEPRETASPYANHDFSAENNPTGKEVTMMTYHKPEISELPNAVSAVEAADSLNKQASDTDGINLHKMTVAAYSSDE